MAKDLPYFKFFCSEWNDGDITLEDYDIQGLFINVCSYYWSNECYLTIDKLKKRFKHNTDKIEYLFKIELIHNENGYLSIHFLDEQKEDRKATSNKNSEAGKKSAEARRLKKLAKEEALKGAETLDNLTSVEITLNETAAKSQPLREEKRREEKIRAFKSGEEFLNGFNAAKGKLTGKVGKFKVMSKTDLNNFKKLNEAYDKADFNHAIKMMSKSDWVKTTDNFNITHFLRNDNFNKYLNQTDTLPMAQGLREGN